MQAVGAMHLRGADRAAEIALSRRLRRYFERRSLLFYVASITDGS
jgi:hypothetical protein